jgi:hypothetical protein
LRSRDETVSVTAIKSCNSYNNCGLSILKHGKIYIEAGKRFMQDFPPELGIFFDTYISVKRGKNLLEKSKYQLYPKIPVKIITTLKKQR